MNVVTAFGSLSFLKRYLIALDPLPPCASHRSSSANRRSVTLTELVGSSVLNSNPPRLTKYSTWFLSSHCACSSFPANGISILADRLHGPLELRHPAGPSGAGGFRDADGHDTQRHLCPLVVVRCAWLNMRFLLR